MADWYDEDAEMELVEMWRQHPELYDTTNAGYLRRGKKYALITKFAEHFKTNGKYPLQL